MKVMDYYDYDEALNRRYKGTAFFKDRVGYSKNHGYSYLHCRKELINLGEVMGLEKEVEREVMKE